jgi:hydroxymethylpyrimidine/phosphomethylpyrimidine kinase
VTRSENPSARRGVCLSIAGSDSGGGAGIQADLKTFAAHGMHGLTAIAALTAQNTRDVRAVHVPPTGFLRAQIEACFEDFDIGAVKIGMLGNAETTHAVADALEHYRPRWIVLDPVMVATSGARLLDADALTSLCTRLLPLASLVTPNIHEAQVLLGHAIPDEQAADAALDGLLALGANTVLLKGGHLTEGSEVCDRYADRMRQETFRHPRLSIRAHGTGCTLASAVTASLCAGATLLKACEAATDYVHGTLAHAYRPARGEIAVLDHFWRHRLPND